MNASDGAEQGLDTGGFVWLVSAGTVRVAGHYLETERDSLGRVHRWHLLCGECLLHRWTRSAPRPVHPRPGLPLDGALRLPSAGGWPAVTLAWGTVLADCDHPGPLPHLPIVPVGAARPRRNRVVFRRGFPSRALEADPILVPGGLWVAVAPGHARRVRSEAFGVRHRTRVAAAPWRRCPP